MPGQNVNWPLPLTRLPPWFPGQLGVHGSDVEQGLRTHASGTVFYVDPNHLDRSDDHDGTDPEHPLATVAEAITRCQAYRGDVIAVMANNAYQYGNPLLGYANPVTEEVILSVPGVRLVGVAPAGTVGVCWEPVTAAGAGTCITVTASDCLIEGFTFEGALLGGRAIYVEWNGTTSFGDNPIIRHCMFDDDIDTAIEFEFVYFGEVHGCIFQEVDAYGIYTNPAGSASAYCYIHDNWFINCTTAAVAVSEIASSLISGNYIYSANAIAAAVATNEGINTSAGAGQNMVCDNYFSCLLPVPANGDYDDLNSADATDAWIDNHCLNGPAVTNPT